MNIEALIAVGCIAGTGAGLLAVLIGIGGSIVVVPVVYCGLVLVRGLMPIMSSGGCTHRLRGAHYECIESAVIPGSSKFALMVIRTLT